MSTDPTAPLNEEEDVLPLSPEELQLQGIEAAANPAEIAALRRGEPYDYEEYPADEPSHDKAHLIGLVTKGRPFVLISLQEDGNAQVDASGLDLIAAYATVQMVTEALSKQIDQIQLAQVE